MTITYTIIHDADEKNADRILSLCADGMLRSGYWSISRRIQTLVYKRKSAAIKRLNRTKMAFFPRIAIKATQETEIGQVSWIIRRGA
jgi:hypothetical protein